MVQSRARRETLWSLTIQLWFRFVSPIRPLSEIAAAALFLASDDSSAPSPTTANGHFTSKAETLNLRQVSGGCGSGPIGVF